MINIKIKNLQYCYKTKTNQTTDLSDLIDVLFKFEFCSY